MMNSTKNPRNTKRVIGLGLAALSMSLTGTVTRADNTTVNSAHLLIPGVVQAACVGNAATEFFYTSLRAGRSYEIWFYTPATERNSSGLNPGWYTNATIDDDSAFGSPITTVQNQFSGEGGPQNNLYSFNRAVSFQITTAGNYFVRIVEGGNGGGCYQVSLRETTLFSPWTSRAAGFEGFIEVHNNTNASVNVTLTGYNDMGVQQGAGVTFAVPANATVFKTAGDAGVPLNIFAGVVLTHDGTFGAISGNITTLNGANGLSFDSPFTPRDGNLRGH